MILIPQMPFFKLNHPSRDALFRHELSFWVHELSLRVTGWQSLARPMAPTEVLIASGAVTVDKVAYKSFFSEKIDGNESD
jgi:hypothetical protein